VKRLSSLVAIAVLAVSLASTAPTEAKPVQSSTDFEAVDRYVRDQMDGSRIPGVSIAVVDGDRVLHARGFGNDGRGNYVTADTPFWIGSNTKSFTALATMQLVEAGKIDLDAPVQRYLPDFTIADKDAASRMSVRHLLNQTSGFSRQTGIEPLLEGKVQSIEEAVADLRNVKLDRPVGSTLEYSNVNSVILGQIIETVTGIKWSAYVEKNILQPLGMSHSYTSLDEARRHGLTAVHKYWFGFPFKTEGSYLPGLAPTGSIYASVSDMARYMSMYLRGGLGPNTRLLSEDGIRDMLTPETNQVTKMLQGEELSYYYGRGWFVGKFGAADDARWHLGNLPYFTAWMVLLPESNQAVVVLINAGSQFEVAGANQVMSRIPIGIVNILRGQEPPSGTGMARFFLVFDAIVTALVALQVWSLLRLAQRPAVLPGMLGYAPLAWELGLATALLLGVPKVLAMSWRDAYSSIPDLTLVLLTLPLLWLATGFLRVVKLGIAYTSGRHERGPRIWRRGPIRRPA